MGFRLSTSFKTSRKSFEHNAVRDTVSEIIVWRKNRLNSALWKLSSLMRNDLPNTLKSEHLYRHSNELAGNWSTVWLCNVRKDPKSCLPLLFAYRPSHVWALLDLKVPFISATLVAEADETNTICKRRLSWCDADKRWRKLFPSQKGESGFPRCQWNHFIS